MRKRILYVMLTIVTIMAVAASAGLFSVSMLTSAVITAPSAEPYIEMGKFYLTSHNILSARDQFKLAVQAEPANQEANFLYGVTRIAAVAEDGQGLNTTGLDSVREIFELAGVVFTKFGLYESIYTEPKELAYGTPRTGAVLDFLKTKLMPEVDGAIANLETVSSPGFTSINNPGSFGKESGAVLTADYADALVTKAMLHALKCNLELLMVYGLDVNLPNIQAAPEELMTYKQLFMDSAFLTPKETARLETARVSLVNFIDTYFLAAQHLLARSGSAHHLFVVDVPLTNELVTAKSLSLNDFKNALAEIKASLNGPYLYTFAPKVEQNNRFIDLSRFFDANNPINLRTKLNELASGDPSATLLNGLFPLGFTGLETRLAMYGADILGVTGAGPGKPYISVTPDSVMVMDPVFFPVAPITIRNAGTASLNISAIGLQGAKSEDFTLDFGTCGSNFPVIIYPGGSCSVTVDLKHPATGGFGVAELQIISNDSLHQTTTIPVTGWVQTQTPPPLSSLNLSPIALFADPATTGTVYVAGYRSNYSVGGTFLNYNGSGVYKSTDSGTTWNQMKIGIANDYYGGDPSVYAFAMDPNNSQHLLLVNSSGGYRSLDGGSSWVLVNGLTSSGVSGFAFATSVPATIYGASYSYLYQSTNSGVNWSNIGTLPLNARQSTLVVDPASQGTLYIGTNNGVYKTVDSGLTWLPVNNGLPASYINSLKFISSTLYAVTSSSLYKSIDGGLNWVNVSINGNSYVNGIVSDPTSTQTMYIYSYNGIFKTVDGGATWNVLPDYRGQYNISFLTVSPFDNKLYAANSRYVNTTTYPNYTYYIDIYKLSTTTAPPPPTYSLNIIRNGTGSGAVKYSGYAINFTYFSISVIPVTNCNATGPCGGSYTEASKITISANPDPGSVFAGWIGCDTAFGTECQVNLFAPQAVTATFNRDQKPLTVLASPSGGTYTTPPEVSLATSKDATIYYTLDGSTPNATSLKYSTPILISQGWSTTLKFIAIDPFGAASSVGTENYIISTANTTLTISSSGVGSGQVMSDTGGINCSSDGVGRCNAAYPNGAPVTLMATTLDSSTFDGWSGDCTGFAPCILAMASDKNVTAHFGWGPDNMGPMARIALTGYNAANDAYIAAGFNSTIFTIAGIHSVGNLLMNQGKNIILKGGYNPFLDRKTNQPTIFQGTLTIDSGSLIVDNVKIRP